MVEELDEKKYLGREPIASVARDLISQLRRQLAPSKGQPVEIRAGVSIEVPVDDEPRRRARDADQEVLDACRELEAVSGQRRVVLVTADAGMAIRASALGLEVREMPSNYLRRKVTDT